MGLTACIAGDAAAAAAADDDDDDDCGMPDAELVLNSSDSLHVTSC